MTVSFTLLHVCKTIDRLEGGCCACREHTQHCGCVFRASAPRDRAKVSLQNAKLTAQKDEIHVLHIILHHADRKSSKKNASSNFSAKHRRTFHLKSPKERRVGASQRICDGSLPFEKTGPTLTPLDSDDLGRA